jgi:hypothetical protein
MTAFLFDFNPWLLPIVMFVVLGLAIELPYRFADKLKKTAAKGDPFNSVQAALLTLSAFVLGLSFSQAAARYDARRAIVVNQANAISTTWLRADQLEPTQAMQFRRTLTNDTAERLAIYRSGLEITSQQVERADRTQASLWTMVSTAARLHPTKLGLSLLMQSLNETIDIIAQQRESLDSHVPTAIVVLTLCLVTLATLSLGLRFAMSESRPLLLSLVYVIAYVIVITMMVDYDRPNTGLVPVSLRPLTSALQAMQRSPY